jgi:acylphosphatase
MEKFWNIRIAGKVQDTGFRSLIEDIARLYDLRGFTFNDIDNSVKMVCCGENGLIEDFLEEIKDKGVMKGAVIEDITSEEIPFKIYLPQKFLRLYTDELSDISRKLDTGIDILREIKNDTSSLPQIKDILNSFVIEQGEHNRRLEKILIKLAEK